MHPQVASSFWGSRSGRDGLHIREVRRAPGERSGEAFDPDFGPEGKATIHVVATGAMGIWWYQTLTAEVAGQPAPIDLLVERQSRTNR